MNYKSLIVLAMMLAVLGISKPVLAHMDKAEHAEHVQSMRQAAAELKGTNPALSAKLSGYADEKEKWADKQNAKWKEKTEDVAKLRAAASELAPTRKDLADDLNAIAGKCEKHMKDQEDNDDNDGKIG